MSAALAEPGEGGRIGLTAAANELRRAANALGRWTDPPGDSAQARQVFYEYAAAMKLDAANLARAASDGTRLQAMSAFEELRGKCDSCHHFFRYGE